MSSRERENAANTPDKGNLQADIALLASLLAADKGDDIDDTDISELLQRLDTAHGVASGVESRLDGILGNLDEILGSLEASSAESESATVNETQSIAEGERHATKDGS